MAKRIGYLYDSFLTIENFINAEKLISKNKSKKKNKRAYYISDHAEEYALLLFRED